MQNYSAHMQADRRSLDRRLPKPTPSARRAVTLVELLVALSIVSLLFAVGIPSLSAARNRAATATCLDHLRELAAASAAYGADDPTAQWLPAHPISDVNKLYDEGFFDYGGASGAVNIWGGARWSANSLRAASTRPLNRYLLGQPTEQADYSLFRCPQDGGLPDRENVGVGDYWDTAMAKQPMFESVGTSYWGNALRGRGSSNATASSQFWSAGVFLRSANRIPASAETVLYCEAVAWEQVTLTGNAGGGPLFFFRSTAAWHDSGKYNFAFCDGHAAMLHVPAGPLKEGWDPESPALVNIQVRGDGFRFDCRPDALIEDRPR